MVEAALLNSFSGILDLSLVSRVAICPTPTFRASDGRSGDNVGIGGPPDFVDVPCKSGEFMTFHS